MIITGANRGIGKAMVEMFSSNGYNVWACARKRNLEFEVFLEELASRYDVWIKPIYFEMADEGDMEDGEE